MALPLNYEKYKRRTVNADHLRNCGWMIVCILLLVASAAGTVMAIIYQLPPVIAILCGIIAVIFIVAMGLTLIDLLGARAERPADLQSIRTLMYLVDQLGNRQEFIDEISALIRKQGELYQYQAYALIMGTQKFGLSEEQLQKQNQKRLVAKNA